MCQKPGEKQFVKNIPVKTAVVLLESLIDT